MDDNPNNEIKRRLGRFLSTIGLALVIAYVFIDLANSNIAAAQDLRFDVFFFGVLLLFIGWLIKRRNPGPQVHSNRFQWIRSVMTKEEKEEKKDKD